MAGATDIHHTERQQELATYNRIEDVFPAIYSPPDTLL